MRPVRAAAARGRLFLAAAALVAGGCASTPEATFERDAEAKQFISQPRVATVYVYRADFRELGSEEQDTVLFVEDRLIGTVLPRTFFRLYVRPGTHLLRGYA